MKWLEKESKHKCKNKKIEDYKYFFNLFSRNMVRPAGVYHTESGPIGMLHPYTGRS